MKISKEQVAAGRAVAVEVVGEARVAKLEKAGLVIVRRADVGARQGQAQVLEGVQLRLPDPWVEPWEVVVVHGTQVLEVLVEPSAMPAVREAAMLARVMGHIVSVEVRDDEVLTHVWTVEA
ncbi:hypothetical protein [Deinococcus peraridilitoris]|uniref:Uncharacterized protein n=1 Tax=Deinococcus peraridilitoris (strain DSM 19664 / LMG 22246 / CIP 109416 / KR-200) TaxID=937777 RepID=K9ZZF8_DEIPD|nr:hypothetical protein [Deinococcus peraridilitoris]AFZ67033.1 hypothetical protein Deipe_1492 [Deinococcus peraridilitoris DSM 19664]